MAGGVSEPHCHSHKNPPPELNVSKLDSVLGFDGDEAGKNFWVGKTLFPHTPSASASACVTLRHITRDATLDTVQYKDYPLEYGICKTGLWDIGLNIVGGCGCDENLLCGFADGDTI